MHVVFQAGVHDEFGCQWTRTLQNLMRSTRDRIWPEAVIPYDCSIHLSEFYEERNKTLKLCICVCALLS